MERELNSENKKRLKRSDQQEAVGRATGGWGVLNSPMQRKGPEQSCRRSGLLPHRVPCGFHWNYRLRWVNPPGKGGKSLRKSFHPLIIQKCPWLPSEGVCTLPHSDSPQGTGQVLSKPSTAKSPLANSDCLGFFLEKCSPSMMGGHGAATSPRPARYTRSQLAFPSPEAVPNASRFLKQTQQRFIKAQRACHKTQGRAEPTHHLGPFPGPGQTLYILTLVKSLCWPPPQFPRPERAIVGSRMVPAILLPKCFTPGNSLRLRRARRHGQPHPPRAQFGLGLRGGAATPGSTPAPAPYVGARRAPRPWWPRYCFTFPGVYFPLSGKERDGGRRAPRLRFPLPGHARCAPDRPEEGLGPTPERSRRPARRRPSSRPPGARSARCRPGPRRPRSPILTSPRPSPSTRRSVCRSLGPGARLWGRAASSQSSGYGTSRRAAPPKSPPPPARAAAPAVRARGAGAAWARGTAPGPAPSRRPGTGGLAGI